MRVIEGGKELAKLWRGSDLIWKQKQGRAQVQSLNSQSKIIGREQEQQERMVCLQAESGGKQKVVLRREQRRNVGRGTREARRGTTGKGKWTRDNR